MPADGADLATRPRQTQAERSATMRAKLIAAAIRCLNRDGYSSTTVALVADEAGVSRGGMLHQFPTKVDLMLEVVRFASSHDEFAEPGVKPNPDKRDYFVRLTDNFWRNVTQPPAMAKLEIMVAARSDAVLAARLPPIIHEIDERRRERVWRLAEELGAKDRAAVDAMVMLHLSAMRGLSIELMFTKDRASVDRAYALLKTYKNDFVARMLAEVGG
jgi:AcrR family transcriptional regulator